MVPKVFVWACIISFIGYLVAVSVWMLFYSIIYGVLSLLFVGV